MATVDTVRSSGLKLLAAFEGFDGCRAAAALPDAQEALLSTRAGKLVRIDLDRRVVTSTPSKDEWGWKALHGLPGGRFLAASIKDVKLVQLGAKGFKVVAKRSFDTTGGVGPTLSSSTDGAAWAAQLYDSLLWTTANGKKHAVKTEPGYSAAMSGDGSRVACESKCTIRLYDAQTPETQRTLGALTCPVISMAFSPDGSKLVTADDVTNLLLWDVETGQATPLDTVGKGVAVSWSPDGSCFAALGLTRAATIFDASGKPVWHDVRTDLGTRYFMGGGFTGDARHLVVGVEDGRLLAWRVGDAVVTKVKTAPNAEPKATRAAKPKTKPAATARSSKEPVANRRKIP